MKPSNFVQILQQLLPPGRWSKSPESVLLRLLHWFSLSLTRVENRANDLLREANPHTAIESLPEWERLLGIDENFGLTTDERRAVLRRKMTMSQGWSSPSQLSAIFASHGWVLDSVIAKGSQNIRIGESGIGSEVSSNLCFNIIGLRIRPPPMGADAFSNLQETVERGKPANLRLQWPHQLWDKDLDLVAGWWQILRGGRSDIFFQRRLFDELNSGLQFHEKGRCDDVVVLVENLSDKMCYLPKGTVFHPCRQNPGLLTETERLTLPNNSWQLNSGVFITANSSTNLTISSMLPGTSGELTQETILAFTPDAQFYFLNIRVA